MAKEEEAVNWKSFRDQQRGDFRKKMLAGKKGKFSAGRKPPASNSFAEKKMPPAWKLRHRDSKFKPDETPTRIRIIPTTEEKPFYKFYTKWIKTPEGQNRNLISNAWNGERDVPCVLYYYCEKEESENYWADEKLGVTVLVLEDFYKIPHTSKNGFEYFTYERVPAADRHGRIVHPSSAHEEYDIVFGRKLWWEMWDSQKRDFESKLDGIGESCSSCGEGEISTYAYACAKCDNEFANHREDAIDVDTEEQLRTMEVECEECKHYAKAKQLIDCVHVKGVGSRKQYVEGCGNPAQLDWSACDVTVSAISVGNRTAVNIDEFSVSEELDVPSWMTEPMDFDYFLGRQDLDDQAKAMGRRNPFDASAQRALDKYFETPRNREDNDSTPVSDNDVF